MPDTAVMAVSVRADPSFSVSAPRFVLDGPYRLDPTGHLAFGVFRDGGLLMIDDYSGVFNISHLPFIIWHHFTYSLGIYVAI